ncbi:MAG TPA: response regulator transcription factor [Actinomycetota bacterium]|nr:response regulator transcription factor [Actinomycetota bacterium]
MTRVVVVEDHLLVRQSLIRTLTEELGFEVVGEAGRGDEAIEVITREKPDIALLDIAIPGGDGLSVASQISKALPEIRLVFLTMHDDDSSVRRAVSLGAAGFLPKTASTEEVVQALQAIAAGGSYLSPGIAKRVLAFTEGTGSHTGRLTDRELEILALLAQGRRPQELADEIFVSIKTVKNHLTSIYAKLGVETAAQAVAEAYRQGLVPRTSASS